MNAIKEKKHTEILYFIMAALLWSFQGLLAKLNSWDPLMLTSFRGIIAALLLGSYRRNFRLKKGLANWIASFSVAATGILFIFAMRLTTAANAVVLQYIMPVFVILYLWIFKKHKPKLPDILCIFVMLTGTVLCCIRGLSGEGGIGNLLALISALTFSVIYLSADSKDCELLSYVYQGSLICVVLFPFSVILTSPVLSGINFLSAAGMGLCVGIGYIFFSKGFSENISPSKAVTVSYVEPVMNPVWVFLFLREAPGGLELLGSAVVLVTAILYALYNAGNPQMKEKPAGDPDPIRNKE